MHFEEPVFVGLNRWVVKQEALRSHVVIRKAYQLLLANIGGHV